MVSSAMQSVRELNNQKFSDFIHFLTTLINRVGLAEDLQVVATREGGPSIKIDRLGVRNSLGNVDLFLRALRGRGYCNYACSITLFGLGMVSTIAIKEVDVEQIPSVRRLRQQNDAYFATFRPGSDRFRLHPIGVRGVEVVEVSEWPVFFRANAPTSIAGGMLNLDQILGSVGLNHRFMATLNHSGQMAIQSLPHLNPGAGSRTKLLVLARTLQSMGLIQFLFDMNLIDGAQEIFGGGKVSLQVVRIDPALHRNVQDERWLANLAERVLSSLEALRGSVSVFPAAAGFRFR